MASHRLWAAYKALSPTQMIVLACGGGTAAGAVVYALTAATDPEQRLCASEEMMRIPRLRRADEDALAEARDRTRRVQRRSRASKTASTTGASRRRATEGRSTAATTTDPSNACGSSGGATSAKGGTSASALSSPSRETNSKLPRTVPAAAWSSVPDAYSNSAPWPSVGVWPTAQREPRGTTSSSSPSGSAVMAQRRDSSRTVSGRLFAMRNR